MNRCKNCGMSIPHNSDGFCGDKCRREFLFHVELKDIDEHAAFNIIAESIIRLFNNVREHKDFNYDEDIRFLSSKLIQMWCDCSDNFNQEKLIKEYERVISASKRNI